MEKGKGPVKIKFQFEVPDVDAVVQFIRPTALTLKQRFGSTPEGITCEVLAVRRQTDCASGMMFKVQIPGRKATVWLDSFWFEETRRRKRRRA